MDEEAFNLSIRKFLKVVGVSSQREIEQAVARAQVAGTETLAATMTLDVPALGLHVVFDGEIKLAGDPQQKLGNRPGDLDPGAP